MSKFVYKQCGCEFDVLKNGVVPSIHFDLDLSKLNLECQKTWDLLSDGNTKGVFQLESRLGQSMAKKLKPENIEQLSALISIMRPGCLEVIRDGKSVSNHFIDKKNGLESVDYFDKSLEPILNKTYGEMIYQEQAMQIAEKISGFNLQEADMLRKAIGKKKPEEMSKLKIMFISGAEKTGIVSEDAAKELFAWIEKSQRYSFNKSHAVSYAFNAFLSAYAKAHFPKIFFTSYLMFAKDKIDPQREIRELVNNAKEMDIDVKLPDIRLMNSNFKISNGSICFGLTNIKGFGESVFKKLENLLKDKDIDINNITYTMLYMSVLRNLNSTAVKALIISGSLDYLNLSRNYMLASMNCLSVLTNKECEKLLLLMDKSAKKTEDIMSFILSLPSGREFIISSSKRVSIVSDALKILQNPPYSLIDSPEWIADSEYETLGVAISCSKVDSCDQMGANTTCNQFRNNIGDTINIACEISDIKTTKTKTGKNPGRDMAFISISDSTGGLNSVVCFPEQYLQFKDLLHIGNTLVISGNKNKDGDSLIIKKMWQI